MSWAGTRLVPAGQGEDALRQAPYLYGHELSPDIHRWKPGRRFVKTEQGQLYRKKPFLSHL